MPNLWYADVEESDDCIPENYSTYSTFSRGILAMQPPA